MPLRAAPRAPSKPISSRRLNSVRRPFAQRVRAHSWSRSRANDAKFLANDHDGCCCSTRTCLRITAARRYGP